MRAAFVYLEPEAREGVRQHSHLPIVTETRLDVRSELADPGYAALRHARGAGLAADVAPPEPCAMLLRTRIGSRIAVRVRAGLRGGRDRGGIPISRFGGLKAERSKGSQGFGASGENRRRSTSARSVYPFPGGSTGRRALVAAFESAGGAGVAAIEGIMVPSASSGARAAGPCAQPALCVITGAASGGSWQDNSPLTRISSAWGSRPHLSPLNVPYALFDALAGANVHQIERITQHLLAAATSARGSSSPCSTRTKAVTLIASRKAAALREVARADILVENFSPWSDRSAWGPLTAQDQPR